MSLLRSAGLATSTNPWALLGRTYLDGFCNRCCCCAEFWVPVGAEESGDEEGGRDDDEAAAGSSSGDGDDDAMEAGPLGSDGERPRL